MKVAENTGVSRPCEKTGFRRIATFMEYGRVENVLNCRSNFRSQSDYPSGTLARLPGIGQPYKASMLTMLQSSSRSKEEY